MIIYFCRIELGIMMEKYSSNGVRGSTEIYQIGLAADDQKGFYSPQYPRKEAKQ
jgi:hypothetical protein